MVISEKKSKIFRPLNTPYPSDCKAIQATHMTRFSNPHCIAIDAVSSHRTDATDTLLQRIDLLVRPIG